MPRRSAGGDSDTRYGGWPVNLKIALQKAIVLGTGSLQAALLVLALIAPAGADGTNVNASVEPPLAIQGHDPVAYFTEGKAVKGSNAHEMLFDDARWLFTSASHKATFAADPDRFMPQYGAFCAGAMVAGVRTPANPENWVIVNGKLYMLDGGKRDLEEWIKHASDNIKSADQNWAKLTNP
jgi:hypothetical protein